MVTTTKGSIDFSKKNTMATNVSSKSTSELYNVNDKNRTYKSKDEKKNDFKDVLHSKSKDKINDDSSKINDDSEKINELKEKLEDLDKGKKLSKEDINDILNSILNLLNKLGDKSDVLKTLQQGTDGVKSLDSIINQLVETLKNGSAKNSLDGDSLSLMKKLLSQLSENFADDNSELGKNIKSGIKDLMSEISNIADNKQGDKVLSLEDILKNNLSQDKEKDGSLGDDSNKNASTEAKKIGSSKEDKFLNSLLDGDKDSSLNKINLFASRFQNAQQGQTVNSTQGVAINQATFADDLIQDVRYMTTNSIKELTVKVNPGNLGEITIKLIQEDGVMKANLKANSKETTALLSQNLVDIKKQLNDQNIKISDVNIELYQDDTTFFKQDGFDSQLSQEQGRNQRNNSNGINSIESISDDNSTDEIEAIDNSNVNFFA